MAAALAALVGASSRTTREVSAYLERVLSDRSWIRSQLFPPDRGRDPGIAFRAIRQRVQVAVRGSWDAYEAEERERAAGAGRGAPVTHRPRGGRPAADDENAGDGSERVRAPEVLSWDDAGRARFRRAVVLAGPGFGKSFLLAFEARRLAQEALDALASGARIDDVVVPILVKLPDVAGADVLRDRILDLAAGASPRLRAALARKMGDGHAVLLLDGLDEVPREPDIPGEPAARLPGFRKYLGQRLADFDRELSTLPMLLTSRAAGYTPPGLAGVEELELLAFDEPEIEAFVAAYFPDEERPRRLLERVRESPHLGELARIPLMLTMLCRLAWDGDPPERRGALYEACLRGFLGPWGQERRGEDPALYVDDRLDLLGFACLELCRRGRWKQLTEAELIDAWQPWREILRAVRPGSHLLSPLVTDAHLLADLKRDGILVPAGGERGAPLELVHRSFQEHLAARELARRARTNQEEVLALVDRHAWDPEWWQVIVLLAGQLSEPEALFQRLRRGPDDIFFHRLALAGHCLDEVPGCASETADRVAWWVCEEWRSAEIKGRASDVEALEGALSAAVRRNPPDPHGKRGRLLQWLEQLLYDRTYPTYAVTALFRRVRDAAGPIVPALMPRLDSEAPAVVALTAHALGDVGPTARAAIPALMRLLDRPESDLRRAAMSALGGIGPAAAPAVPGLAEILTAGVDDPDTRNAAAWALMKIGPPAYAWRVAIFRELRSQMFDDWLNGLARMGPLDDALVAELSAWAREGRSESVLAHLAEVAPGKLAELLPGLPLDASSRSFAAVKKVSHLQPRMVAVAVELARSVLSRSSSEEPRYALFALQALGPLAMDAWDDVAALLRSGSHSYVAARTLAAMGPDRLAPIHEWVSDRLAAGEAPEAALRAVDGLGGGPPALEEQCALYLRGEFREAAAGAMASFRTKGAVEAIIQSWSDGYVDDFRYVMAVCRAIERLAASNADRSWRPGAVEFLRTLLRLAKGDHMIRSIACDALASLGVDAAAAVPDIVNRAGSHDLALRTLAGLSRHGLRILSFSSSPVVYRVTPDGLVRC